MMDMDTNDAQYMIKLPQFEGPFDLLLFFIERDELDIHNIPIAKITHDFLEYIKLLEALNIDVASEFILVASTLMRIKAKLLLPRKELDEEGNEIDPRDELVQRLIEYKRYKSVLEDLQRLEKERQAKRTRGNAGAELKLLAADAATEAEWESLSLYKLLTTFQQVLKRMEAAKKSPNHVVIKYDYTVKGEQEYLLHTVAQGGRSGFADLFDSCETRIHAIFRFLALLELVQLDRLRLDSADTINVFWVSAMPDAPAE